MKRTLLAFLLALIPLAVPAQDLAQPTSKTPPTQAENPTPQPRFDLNFPGGGPEALVTAIENASGKPLNVIIPNDLKDIQIPPLKMTAVTARELFETLTPASIRTVLYLTGVNSYSQYVTSYGFVNPGKNDTGVWYFKADRAPQIPSFSKDVCRFYQLEPFLQHYKIQDITTAIRTGWEMLHVAKEPLLKFHTETKLLIAVGSEDNLKVIENVLRQLETGPSAHSASAQPEAPQTSPSH